MLHPTYETYLVDDELGPDLALRFVTIPARSLGQSHKMLRMQHFQVGFRPTSNPLTLNEVANILELRISYEVTTPLELPSVLLYTLQNPPILIDEFVELESELPQDDPVFSLVTKAAAEPFVAVENSPLEAQSLISIVSRYSLGGGTGAVAGLVTTGSGWVLLISVPAGIILCGAAQGIAAALDQGLRHHLLRHMNVPPETGFRVTIREDEDS